jgi:hypothetical protein
VPTIPIVFASVTYAGLARHYDNVTGVIAIEPRVAESVGFLHPPPAAPKDFFQLVEAAAASHGLKLVPTALPPLPGGPTLDATIAQFAAEPKAVSW